MTQGTEAYFADHQESGDLGRKALRGGVVSVAMQYCNGVLQILAAIILARLLTPRDFGLVAIITVLTSFAPLLIDFGLGDATTQRSKITPSQISSLFWVCTGVGVAAAIVLVAFSPLIARLYHEPLLKPISLCTAITFVLWGASNQHLALLRRTMQFGRIASIQFLGTLIGIVVAIALAVAGYGYWALVARPIANALFVTAGAWLSCRWRPGLPAFDDEVKSMVRFGLHVVGFSVTYTVAKAVDRIGVGLFYSRDQLGYYQNAVTLFENSIFAAFAQVHTVGSAALSKLQSNPVALRQKYEAALSIMAFFLMPASAILSVTAQDLVVILLGAKWRIAGSLLAIIALRGIFQAIELSQGWLHLSIGRVDRWRNWGIISLAFQTLAVIAGLRFGPEGVAVATVLAHLLLAIPSITYAGRPIGVGWTALVIRAAGPQLIGAICVAGVGAWLQMAFLAHYSSLARIVLSTVFCSCLYLAIVVGIFRRTEPLRVARSVVQGRLRSRR
jgi:O-antigen/teichoic acid export membrane protein